MLISNPVRSLLMPFDHNKLGQFYDGILRDAAVVQSQLAKLGTFFPIVECYWELQPEMRVVDPTE